MTTIERIGRRDQSSAVRRPAWIAPVVVLLPLLIGASVAIDVRLTWAAVLSILVFIVILERPAIAGLLLVVVVPITSGLPEGTPFPLLRPSEAAILGCGMLLLILPIRAPVQWNRLDSAVAVYCVGSIVLTAFHEIRSGDLQSNFVEVIAPVQFLLLYRVVASTLRSESDRSKALRWMVLSSIPVALIGILQQFDVGPTRQIIISLTGEGIFQTWTYRNLPRATSIFPIWHAFAGYLSVVILLGVSRLTTQLSRQARAETVTALGFCGAALALTQTFTSIFAVAFGTVLIMRRQRSWALARWVLVLLGIAAAFFGSFLAQRFEEQWVDRPDSSLIPQSVDYRIEVWTEQYFPLVGRYWVSGYGTGVPPEVDWEYTESGYLTLLFRGGLPLILLAGVLLANAHVASSRSLGDRETSTVDRSIALCAFAVTLALIPMNLVWPYFTNSGLSQPYFVILALVRAALHDSSGPDTDDAWERSTTMGAQSPR